MWEQFLLIKVFKRSVISFLSIEFKMDSHIKVNSVSIKSLLLRGKDKLFFNIIIQCMIKNYKTSGAKETIFVKLISRNSRATDQRHVFHVDYRLY
jgi:hypothetical protein